MDNNFAQSEQGGNTVVRRGDIVLVDFEPILGCATNGRRPALVISNNKGNIHSPTIIVAAITSRLKKLQLPTHLIVECNTGLRKKSMLLLEQLRTIDKGCIVEKTGNVSADFMKQVDTALSISIGLDPAYNS